MHSSSSRREVKQPLGARAQNPDQPSAPSARVCPPSPFLAAGGSPASVRPSAPLQPRGSSFSAAQPLIIKGILFFAALLPKCFRCLIQFVSRTPAVILFLPPSLPRLCPGLSCPLILQLPLLECSHSCQSPFPWSPESINPDDALRLHAHELGLFGLTRLNCSQSPARRHTGALCYRKNHLAFGVTAATTCCPRGSCHRHALSI